MDKLFFVVMNDLIIDICYKIVCTNTSYLLKPSLVHRYFDKNNSKQSNSLIKQKTATTTSTVTTYLVNAFKIANHARNTIKEFQIHMCD